MTKMRCELRPYETELWRINRYVTFMQILLWLTGPIWSRVDT